MNQKELRPIRLEIALGLSDSNTPEAKKTLAGLIETDPVIGTMLDQILGIEEQEDERRSSEFTQEEYFFNKVVQQPNCTHPKVTQQSTENKVYDILNGIKITREICPVCHKVLSERVEIL